MKTFQSWEEVKKKTFQLKIDEILRAFLCSFRKKIQFHCSTRFLLIVFLLVGDLSKQKLFEFHLQLCKLNLIMILVNAELDQTWMKSTSSGKENFRNMRELFESKVSAANRFSTKYFLHCVASFIKSTKFIFILWC